MRAAIPGAYKLEAELGEWWAWKQLREQGLRPYLREGRLRIKSRRRPTDRHVRYVLADIPPRAESEIFLAVAIDVPSISAISLATHTL